MKRLLLVAALAACDPSSEEEFTKGRSYDPCLQTIPACPGLVGRCTLDGSRYARQTFPGDFRFMVNANAGHIIQVLLYFADQRDAGLSTQIFWNEPGCSEVYVFDSEGRNLFAETEDLNLFTEKREVAETGEHLIEIFSDMQAEVLVTAEVVIPGT
jgi:hypothetical protein